MKLEPNRINLSTGCLPREPDNLRIPPTQAAPALLRVCSSCGANDIVHRVEGSYEPGGQATEEHFIIIDIRFLKNAADFTPRYKARGWEFLKAHQGRMAMKRFICRPCLIGHAEMEREQKRKIDQELKSNSVGDSYYLAVCGE